MPHSFFLALLDRTYRSAWWRFLRLWKPMALWTLLVWLLFGVVLVPLSSAALGALIFRGDWIVVANVDLLAWVLRPAGLLFVLVAGGLAITASVVRFAGMFRIITDDLEGRSVSVRDTLLEILPDVPALFKLCVMALIGVVVLLIPLLAGLGVIYLLVLGEHDINYYAFMQPPEWRTALILGSLWGATWLAGAVYVVLHSLPLFPAYLDGHRPARHAFREAWRRTRGRAMRVLWLLFLSVAGWLLIRAMAQASFYLAAGQALAATEAITDSLGVIVLATAAYAIGSFVIDATVSFIGFSFAATVLTKFYHEDTNLHATAPAIPEGWRTLPREGVRLVRTWAQPRRAVPIALLLLMVSAGLTAFVVDRLDHERTIIITAHRAGALLAPENTIAALELTIEAGVDFAEIDVQRTRDGEVIVVHDVDLMRVAGDPRRIADLVFDEVAHLVQGPDSDMAEDYRRIATLDQFLERSRGRIGLNIELKYYGPDPALADSVVAKVRRWGMEDEVVIMSIELAGIRQVQELAPEIPVGYVAALAAGDLARVPVDFLAVSRPLATHPLVRSARRRGVEVHVWTLNRAEPMFEMIERGVDGIITDDPFLARRVVEEFAALSTAERILLRLRRTAFDLDSETVSR
jgi:glycerophosphoryl diester phosphodiesterase